MQFKCLNINPVKHPMNADFTSVIALNEKRRLAVKLRLEGRKLKEISELVDLSFPTIIAAHKQFLSGGWDAVKVNPRGRPSGENLVSEETLERLKLEAFRTPTSSDSVWTFARLAETAKNQGGDTSARSVGKLIDQWGLGAANLYKKCKSDGLHNDWLNTRYKSMSTSARQSNASIYWAGLDTCNQHDLASSDPTATPQKYLYAHTTRGQYCWLAGDYKNDVEQFIDFFNRLSKLGKQKLLIIWRGFDPQAQIGLKEWLDQSPDISIFLHPGLHQGLHPETAAIQKTPDTKAPDQEIPGQKTLGKNGSKKTSNLSGHSSVERLKPSANPDLKKYKVRPDRDRGNQATEPEHQSPPFNKPTYRTLNMLTHLQRLEAESIHIIREVIAEADKPVMLYSIGKDSAVMLHLALKAFYPARPPFPLLHVDTRWKFQAMYELRDQVAKDTGMQLITHINPEGVEKDVNPFSHGSSLHTDIMKTTGLRQALDHHGFDVAFGGARRDEEKSRAKERVFSFRTEQHRWDPKNQRPELWNLYNAKKKKGESIRAFPLSNWTELDVWHYIHQENITVVPLYFAAERPVVLRDGSLIMVDDDRMPMNEGEVPVMKQVRFRTLGCYPLTGAIESNATSVTDVISEMLQSNHSERQGRMIDHDSAASMEKKKQEGYF